MTLNSVIALFCVISPNSIALQADYVTVVEARPIMSAKYRLPVTFGQTWPTLQRGLSAIAALLVRSSYGWPLHCACWEFMQCKYVWSRRGTVAGALRHACWRYQRAAVDVIRSFVMSNVAHFSTRVAWRTMLIKRLTEIQCDDNQIWQGSHLWGVMEAAARKDERYVTTCGSRTQ